MSGSQLHSTHTCSRHHQQHGEMCTDASAARTKGLLPLTLLYVDACVAVPAVLYEDTAVEPVAAVVGRLLKPGSGSSLLLADPPNRTVANRQRFVELLSGGLAGGINLRLEESGIYQCDVSQLDPGMKAGVTTQSVGVQFMAFRAAVGNDTIGIKFY